MCANWLNSAQPELCRAGRVKYFFRHNITLEYHDKLKDKVTVQPLLAYIEWYKQHPEKNFLPSPVTLWYPDLEPIGAASFMPINRIACRCAQSQSYMTFTERPYNSGQWFCNSLLYTLFYECNFRPNMHVIQLSDNTFIVLF